MNINDILSYFTGLILKGATALTTVYRVARNVQWSLLLMNNDVLGYLRKKKFAKIRFLVERERFYRPPGDNFSNSNPINRINCEYRRVHL